MAPRDDGPDREAAVERLAGMLHAMIKRADKQNLQLAPFIGIGCPGLIREDGSIDKGGQNLPGDWGTQKLQSASAAARGDPNDRWARNGGIDA